MKAWQRVSTGALALVMATTVGAVNISNLSGQSCGNLSGTWHFVNNQTGGAPAGSLTATWSSGDSCTVGASKVSASNQHFYCTASGTLASAATNLPGKLVLSDFSCQQVCVDDPKTEVDECKK